MPKIRVDEISFRKLIAKYFDGEKLILPFDMIAHYEEVIENWDDIKDLIQIAYPINLKPEE